MAVGCLTFEARSQKGALAAALEKLRALFAEDEAWEPIVLVGPRASMVGWKGEGGGWLYKLRDTPAELGSLVGGCNGVPGGRLQCMKMMRRHMAQIHYEPNNPHATGMDWLLLADEEGRKDHQRWVRWQDAYARAEAQGKSDEECRREADLAV